MAVPTIASGALRKMLAVAGELGVKAADVLGAVGVDAAVLEDADGRIPIVTLHAAWEAVLSRDPRARGVFVGAGAYTPGDYGVMGYVAMSSATLGEAMVHFVRYIGLWTDEPSFDREGATIVFAYRQSFRDGPGRRAALEAAPAEIVHGARMITQRRIVPREVRFAHPAPEDVSGLEGFLGCRVRFEARDNALVLRQKDLAVRLPKADPQLVALLRGVANEALSRRSVPGDSPLDQVRAIIAEELSRGVPGVDVVARRMATSERTLRRRLEHNGTSFRELLDDTRARLARSYVRDRRMPLAEVAFMLGFSEPSAFHRAFKRWTSTTPAAWRARG